MVTALAKSGEKQPGELPDFSRYSWEVENRPDQAIHPISPESKEQCRVASQLAAEGRTEHAIQQYRAVLDTDAANPLALSSLAWILATTDKLELRSGPEAVRLATRAGRID